MEELQAGNHKGRLLAVGQARGVGRRLAAGGYLVTYAVAGKARAALEGRRYEAAILCADSMPLAEDLLRSDPALGLLLLDAPEDAFGQALPRGRLVSSVALPAGPRDLEPAVEDLLARRRLLRNSQRLEAVLPLLEASKALRSEADLRGFLRPVAETVARETLADRVALLLREGEDLVPMAVVGVMGGSPSGARVGEGIAGRVAQTGEGLLLPGEGRRQPALRKLLSQEGASSALCLPLVASSRVIGVLDSRKDRPGPPFCQEDMGLVSALCGLAALALQKARLSTQLQKEELRSQSLMRQMVLAQENERRRISLEIHDGAAQWVVGASYHAQAARAALPQDPSLARDHLEATHRVLSQTIQEMRQMVGDLHGPDREGTGLLATLKEMTAYLEARAGLRCKVSIRCEEEDLSPETRITVYRIAQEALRNVQKHAQASRLEFLLSQEGQELVMTIADDGCGFSLPAALERASHEGHLGLLGIQERAEALGGAAMVTTQPGQGTRVGVRLPLAIPPAMPGPGDGFIEVLRT